MNRAERRRLEKDQGGSSNGHLPWSWKDVELSNGTTVKVRTIPPYLAEAAVAHLAVPRPPIIEIPSQLPGGGVTRREDPTDIDYLHKLQEVNEEREKIIDTYQLAWGVDVEIPEDDSWMEEVAEFFPNIKWGQNHIEKKADYIRYVLITNTVDLLKIKRAVAGISIPLSEVQSMEDSFRDQGGRPEPEEPGVS